MDYESQYCDRCVHQQNKDGSGCAVWIAHMLNNYKECNNPDSILHLLIPKEKLGNGECRMFAPKEDPNAVQAIGGKLAPHLLEWAEKRGVRAVKQ